MQARNKDQEHYHNGHIVISITICSLIFNRVSVSNLL